MFPAQVRGSHPVYLATANLLTRIRKHHRFLQILFPLIACGLSLFLIIFRVSYRYVVSRKRVSYEPLSGRDPVEVDDAQPSVGNDGRVNVSDQLLFKGSHDENTRLELDRPRGQVAVVVLEIAILVAQVVMFIVLLKTDGWGHHGTFPAIGRLVSWGYILSLALVRLSLTIRDLDSSPRFWNHSTALYIAQWVFTVFVFRSAVVHPMSKRALTFSAVEFALSSLLLLIASLCRKGNRVVVVPYENDLQPPQYPTASLASLTLFSWLSPLIYKAYRQPLELEDIPNLPRHEKAVAILSDFRRNQPAGRLLWRLAHYFYKTLLIQGSWAVVSNLCTFIPTLLLRAILQYVEDPRSTTPSAAWLFAILLFFSGAIRGLTDAQALWIGRRMGLKLRAIVIGEIYAKALRRKASASADPAKTAQRPIQDKKKNKLFSFGRKKKQQQNATADPEANTSPNENSEAGESDQLANIGTIINLMAIDSFKVSEVGAYLHFLWAAVPVQVVAAVTLLYYVMGFSSFAGIGLMVLALPLNLFIAKQFTTVQKRILAGTDARINATNEILQNIRIIKFFAWEQRFENVVDEKRRVELKALRSRYIIWATAATVWYGTPILITFMSFLLYTVVERKPLTPSIAFPALAMFNLLRVPLDQLADMVAHVQESKASLDRVDTYLNEEETNKFDHIQDSNVTGNSPRIAMDNATFSWASSNNRVTQTDTANDTDVFRLIDMTVDFHIGKLNVIAGKTGSGKTSMLMALLGEMNLLEGAVHLPGGCGNRADLPVNPQTGLIESAAYCAQEAWLVNDTIKGNIVFASPWDERRYNAVIKACALQRDLEILDAGDQTMVGERGISLSGGQKQRISLARAIYSKARHLLLDDCLSAVDSHTAKHIFSEALMGPLMIHRTCILVTHNIALTASHAAHIVVVDNGKVLSQGHPDHVAASGSLGEALKSQATSGVTSQELSRVPSDLENRRREEEPSTANGTTNVATNGTANGIANGSTDKAYGGGSQAKLTESKAVGGVKWSTIFMYLRAMGPWYFWVSTMLIFIAEQLGSMSTNIWIRQWANSYNTQPVTASDHSGRYAAMTNFKFSSLSAGSLHRSTVTVVPEIGLQSTEINTNVNVGFYLGIYLVLGVAYLLIALVREGALFGGSLNASSKVHKRLLNKVMHAKFRFFDSTPLGQLMNRFSKDVEAVDQEVAPLAIGMAHCLAAVIMIVVLISVITPAFLIAAVFVSIVYVALGAVYVNSSRDLKRIESVSRSPLYQQFGETLTGVVTIRAYGDGPRFIDDNHNRINAYNRPHIHLWAANRWLASRIDVTGALVSFFSAAFVLIYTGRIDAGAAGLSLTYSVTFTENVLWLVRMYSDMQQGMNSVERVKEYLDVDQEADAVIPDSRPPANWPEKGAVDFTDYTTRYRPDLDSVLRDVSFRVQPGEKVGIVGRTGAGKSSLALALFRGLEAETGGISIDGVDIGTIGLRDLREAITIVPQDPTLFTGTIRTNLDPFDLFSDDEIFTALRRVHLISSIPSGAATPRTATTTSSDSSVAVNGPAAAAAAVADNKNIFYKLSTHVSESGSNLSQGQRQLLCLARALLKNSRVLMMDEATASIDYNTDAKIQETLRELRDSTIITIAHRLQTIIDYDKVLVLDHGRVVEYDHPWTLISKEDGLFQDMCRNSGNMDTLLEGAKRAWEQKRLVDDS